MHAPAGPLTASVTVRPALGSVSEHSEADSESSSRPVWPRFTTRRSLGTHLGAALACARRMVHIRKASRRASAAARRWARVGAAEDGVGRPPAPQELRRALAVAHFVRTVSLSGEMQPAMQSMLLGSSESSPAGSASGGGRLGTGIGAEGDGAIAVCLPKGPGRGLIETGSTQQG
jgi:hypothetical protein